MAREPSDPVDRSLPRASPLAWSGAKPPEGGSGFVGSVGLNAPAGPRLAVDPEGTVPPRERPAARSSAVLESARGPRLEVSVLAPPDEGRERKGGRFRLPRG